jgi:primosomal protein N'
LKGICKKMLLPSQHKELAEAYKQIYLGEIDDITDVMIEEIIEELAEECLEFGYELDEVLEAVENASCEYFETLDEATVTYGSDTESPEQRKARAKEKHGAMKSAARKAAVKGAVERVKAKAKGAKAAAGIAGSIAKDEARRAGRAAAHAVTSTVQKKKAEVKKGVKGLLKKGLSAVAGGAGAVAQKARKVGAAAGKAADRLGEEADLFDYILEHLVSEGYADTNENALVIMANMSEEWRQSIVEDSAAYAAKIAANNKKYDAARKRAAQRAQARNDARDRGQTGSVPGVGYVTPRRERTTYTDAAGTERHHSGAKAK